MVNRFKFLTKENSFFLFGPRGTGKTTLLRETFSTEQALFIDLLDPSEEDAFQRNPLELRHRAEALDPRVRWMVIDEVQKAPRLLDLVHQLIESTPLRFALTGSSGRKLKRGASNLLAGRAFIHHLHPLTSVELGPLFNLSEALSWGTLPKLQSLAAPAEKEQFLRAYALTYMKEELFAEQLVRRIEPFRNFLEVAAQCNGKILNFSRIGEDVGVDVKTVQAFFSILEDTYLGTLLPPYHRSVRKRQRMNPKFYFFDTGVKRALERTLSVPLLESTYAYGEAFEHFLIIELFRLASYRAPDWRFSYLRTKDDAEIDLVIERPGAPTALFEIKSTERIAERDVSTLNRFIPDLRPCEPFCLSRDPHEKKLGEIWCLPWNRAFMRLGLVK